MNATNNSMPASENTFWGLDRLPRKVFIFVASLFGLSLIMCRQVVSISSCFNLKRFTKCIFAFRWKLGREARKLKTESCVGQFQSVCFRFRGPWSVALDKRRRSGWRSTQIKSVGENFPFRRSMPRDLSAIFCWSCQRRPSPVINLSVKPQVAFYWNSTKNRTKNQKTILCSINWASFIRPQPFNTCRNCAPVAKWNKRYVACRTCRKNSRARAAANKFQLALRFDLMSVGAGRANIRRPFSLT